MYFLIFSQEIFESFLKNVPTNYVLRPKREHLTQGFNFLEKSHKIILFCNFLKKYCGNFQNFLASGGLCPPDPLRGRPPKMFPPRTEILAAPLIWMPDKVSKFWKTIWENRISACEKDWQKTSEFFKEFVKCQWKHR